MTTALVITIIVLWLLLGHATRLMHAITRGGAGLSYPLLFWCYLAAPIEAIRFMFDGLFHRG